jgi:multiple sugar transport system permease protein
VSVYEQQKRWGWIFLSPWLIGFFVFTFIPIVASLIFSFTDFYLTRPNEIRFVGLSNWTKLFNDPLALNALRVTFGFAILSLPVAIALPVLLAALLNSKYLLGKPFFRLLFYLPYMVPAISGIFIWQAFLNGQTGWLNRLLRLIGIAEPPNWLGNEFWIAPAMVLMGVWGVGNAMLITLATLQGVPQELYDAAKVDGAGAVTAFFKVTLPMISPVIFYNLILSVIGLLQFFVVPYVLTRGTGNPNGAAYFFNMHLYRTAFLFQDMGYGATMAWFIFLIAIVLTIILFATSRRWVYYAGGE